VAAAAGAAAASAAKAMSGNEDAKSEGSSPKVRLPPLLERSPSGSGPSHSGPSHSSDHAAEDTEDQVACALGSLRGAAFLVFCVPVLYFSIARISRFVR
jgi:hypothetical protein